MFKELRMLGRIMCEGWMGLRYVHEGWMNGGGSKPGYKIEGGWRRDIWINNVHCVAKLLMSCYWNCMKLCIVNSIHLIKGGDGTLYKTSLSFL